MKFQGWTLIKSAGHDADGDPIVSGPLHDLQEDFDGETMEKSGLLNGLRTFFKLGGQVDREHMFYTTRDLKDIVGVAKGVSMVDGVPWLTVKLDRDNEHAMKYWNAVQKGIPCGFSIMGKAIKRDGSRILDTIITMVTIALQPKSFGSRLQAGAAPGEPIAMGALAKALAAGDIEPEPVSLDWLKQAGGVAATAPNGNCYAIVPVSDGLYKAVCWHMRTDGKSETLAAGMTLAGACALSEEHAAEVEQGAGAILKAHHPEYVEQDGRWRMTCPKSGHEYLIEKSGSGWNATCIAKDGTTAPIGNAPTAMDAAEAVRAHQDLMRLNKALGGGGDEPWRMTSAQYDGAIESALGKAPRGMIPSTDKVDGTIASLTKRIAADSRGSFGSPGPKTAALRGQLQSAHGVRQDILNARPTAIESHNTAHQKWADDHAHLVKHGVIKIEHDSDFFGGDVKGADHHVVDSLGGHKRRVKEALKAGHPVPEHVVKEYPDLHAEYMHKALETGSGIVQDGDTGGRVLRAQMLRGSTTDAGPSGGNKDQMRCRTCNTRNKSTRRACRVCGRKIAPTITKAVSMDPLLAHVLRYHMQED
jgi:hypothetical protein